MAVQNRGGNVTFPAGADLSAKQYYITKLAAGEVVLADDATDLDFLGVLENDPKENEPADVNLFNSGGVGKVVAGGSFSAGARLTTDGNGKAIATTTAGNYSFGYALQGGADGRVVEYVKDPITIPA